MSKRAAALAGVVGVLIAGYLLLEIADESSAPARPGGELGVARSTPKLDGEIPTLPVTRILGSENTFGWVFKLEVASDDSLLVVDGQPLVGEERLLVVDRGTGQIRHRTAAEGEGPGEVSFITSISLVPGNDPVRFSVYDTPARRLTTFSLSPWNRDPESISVNDDPGSHSAAEWLGDTELVMNGRYDDHLLRFYSVSEANTVMKPTGRSGQSLYPSAPSDVRRRLNNTNLAVSPDGRRIVLSFTLVDLLYFFDSTGDLIHIVDGPGRSATSYRDGVPYNTRTATTTYQDMAVSRDHVFGLYSGLGTNEGVAAGTIHVFSWDGELRGAYHLEQKILFLAVDPDSQVLYGAAQEPFPQIVEYALPAELRSR